MRAIEFQRKRCKETAEEMNKTHSIQLKWTALALRLVFAQQKQREQELLAKIARLETENARLQDEVNLHIALKKKRMKLPKRVRDAKKRQMAGSASVELGEGLAAEAAADNYLVL